MSPFEQSQPWLPCLEIAGSVSGILHTYTEKWSSNRNRVQGNLMSRKMTF